MTDKKVTTSDTTSATNETVVALTNLWKSHTDNIFYMAGTEQTGSYKVPLVTNVGRIGIRRDERVKGWRIRVEPLDSAAAKALAPSFLSTDNWKQPGQSGQFRFSLMVYSTATLTATLKKAFQALLALAKDSQNKLVALDANRIDAAVLANLRDVIDMINHTTGDTNTQKDSKPEVIKDDDSTQLELLSKLATMTKPAESDKVIAKLRAAQSSERDTLIAKLKAAKVPGANFAANWSLAVLRDKVAKLNQPAN